mgnify:CR=1 FL=1
MPKKCLVIVPHPDDEINIAGSLFGVLDQNDFFTYVAMISYGDYYPKMASVRCKEAQKAQEVLGYDTLFFLGYGDDYNGCHIYDAEKLQEVKSHSGRIETFDVNGIKTYHRQKTGEQCRYTRGNLKNDIKSLLMDLKADILVCVDVDNHPDHKALSLLFDEVIGEILKETVYRPIILKKFAYLGVYKGPNDFYKNSDNFTLPCFFNVLDEKLSYPYLWDDRLRIPTPNGDIQLQFWKTKLYRALHAHRSQRAISKFGRIVNDDIVYWLRRVDSLTYTAKLLVSSGDQRYLNDFKIVDTDDIRNSSPLIIPSERNVWKPCKEDKEPTITFLLDASSTISCIVIYQNLLSSIERCRIETDNGFNEVFDIQNSYQIHLDLPKLKGVSNIKITFLVANNLAINEIEIYSERNVKIDAFLQDMVHEEKTVGKKDNSKWQLSLCKNIYSLVLLYVWLQRLHERIHRKILKLIQNNI